MIFEWDENKNRTNLQKHGICFEDAARIFEGPTRIFEGPTLETIDDRRDYGETRIAAMGVVNDVILYVVYTMRGDARRLISARRANARERRKYREIFPERTSTSDRN